MKFSLIQVALILGTSALHREYEGHSYSEEIPSFYDVTSGHAGPRGHMIPERFKDPVNADRMMHHLIRYYGKQELGKCNTDQKALEGEDTDDWKKPVNFVGEFPDCGKPTGRIWLYKDGGMAAGREAVKEFYGFEDKKLEEYCAEHLAQSWKHFDVNDDGKIEIERAPQFLRMILGNVEIAYGVQ